MNRLVPVEITMVNTQMSANLKTSLADFHQDILSDLLTRLYDNRFKIAHVRFPTRLDVKSWASEIGINETDAQVLIRLYQREGIIEQTLPTSASLSGHGVEYCEEQGLVNVEYKNRNRRVRFVILKIFDLQDEAQKRANLYGALHIGPADGTQELRQKENITDEEFRINSQILEDLGLLIRNGPINGLTDLGRARLANNEAREYWSHSFNEMFTDKLLSPQQRGHQLEQLLMDICKFEGWEVKKSVRTTGQEHDLILNRNLDYYFVQCKWEGKKVQPHAISVLRDRVTSRPGTRGIFVSMSGFTQAAIQETSGRLEACLMILYGSRDISSIVNGNVTFSELLALKYHDAVVSRRMLIDSSEEIGKLKS